MHPALPLVRHAHRALRRPARPLAGGVTAVALVAALLAGVGTSAAQAADATSTTTAVSTTTTTTRTTPGLSWAPPALTSPTTVVVTPTNRNLKLDVTKDYVVTMPATPLTGLNGLQITGGRNVVLIGGRIELPVEAITGTTQAGRGLYLKGQTGTVHVEGLYITGPGLEEGINIDAPNAVVQLQNIRVDLVRGYAAGHHADVIQVWGGPRRLLVDGLTGYTQYQGLFLLPTQYGAAQPELFDLRRVDLHGTPDSAYMIWRDSQAWPLTATDVYVAPRNPLNRDSFLWPKGTGQGTSAWPSVNVGTPPAGEFVPASSVGLGYTSPGYGSTGTDSTQEVLEAAVAYNPPVGALESVAAVPGGLRVTGWAADADTPEPVSVDVTVGATTLRVAADQPRSDVAQADAGVGGATGFETVVPLPVGTHDVCVTAVNVGSGTDTALGCAPGTVADTTTPTVTGPSLALRGGTVSSAGVVPVTAQWATGDDVAVTGTRLTAPVTGTYAADVRSAEHTVAAGTSTWTLEADDAAGNVGTASADATVTLVPESATSRYDYWWGPQGTQFLGGAAVRTNRSGASMTYAFTGRSVAWVASRESTGGLADVYVDGVKEATVDLAAPTTATRQLVFTRSWDSAGAHTIKVVARTTGGKVVTSDGFVTVG